ncbi:MAG: hypothetical protein V1765_03240 [bacterium]
MFKKYRQFIFITAMIFGAVGQLQAAEFFWQPAEQIIGLNQQFSVRLLLAPAQQSVNAISGQVQWPSDLVELVSVNQGNSIVPLWITLVEHNDSYNFSGMIPGGFDGMLSPLSSQKQPGQILTLIFSAKQIGQGTVSLVEAEALLHDGQGTADQVTTSTLNFTVQDTAVPELVDNLPKLDKKAPEKFTPQLVQSPDLFDNQWVLIFATQDKGSGLAYYTVQEGDEEFSPVISPYLLKNQDLHEKIIVRAIDQAGNVQEVVVQADQSMIWYANPIFYGIIIAGVLVFTACCWFIIKRRKNGGSKRKK